VGLASDDAKPDGITVEEAYGKIRSWYQANVDRYEADGSQGSHAQEAKAYINSLPPSETADRGEMKDTLFRVLCRDLEWGYHESDGDYKMAAYAHAAFETEGEDPFS
jgi:hypothetical protein